MKHQNGILLGLVIVAGVALAIVGSDHAIGLVRDNEYPERVAAVVSGGMDAAETGSSRTVGPDGVPPGGNVGSALQRHEDRDVAMDSALFELFTELEQALDQEDDTSILECMNTLELMARESSVAWRRIALMLLALHDVDIRLRAGVHELLVGTAPSVEAARWLQSRLTATARLAEETVERRGESDWVRTVLEPSDDERVMQTLQATPRDWLGRADVVSALELLAAEGNALRIRVRALYLLGFCGDSTASTGILDLMEHDVDPQVRAAAVRAIGSLGIDHDSAGRLQGLLADEREDVIVQRFAALGLSRVAGREPVAARSLARVVSDHPDTLVRRHAMRGLFEADLDDLDSRAALAQSLVQEKNVGFVLEVVKSISYLPIAGVGREIIAEALGDARADVVRETLAFALSVLDADGRE